MTNQTGKIIKLWRNKVTEKYSFIQTDSGDYALIFSQTNGYIYEKDGGDNPPENDELVDLSTLIDDFGQPITHVNEGYTGGFADYIGMETIDSFHQCEVCHDWFRIHDPIFAVFIDDCECGHMEINENGDWVTK